MKTERLQSSGTEARAGTTLVEVVIALALITLMTMGLYALGMQTRKYAEHNRVATEARSLAKERIEEMISLGFDNLVKPSCTLLNADSTQSSLGYAITRTPTAIWHAANGTIASASNAVYAEVHVSVSYYSPIFSGPASDTYSSIVQ